MQIKPDKLLYSVDLAGTLLFGIEGATAAITGDLDLLGLLVLAFATALGGGIVRDVLIGAVPPSALRDWRYPTTAFAGAAIVFFFHRFVQGIPAPVILILDAAGLALFAIAGTEKALLHNMSPLIAALLGTITAVGGGTIRDILLARIPAVLRADVYATAALARSAVMLLCRRLGLPPTLSAFLGGSFCFLLRIVSVWRHWNLPKLASF
jgi:uncharacterized membrane protein YeiH